MATVVHGDFEWDDEKAEANLAKHGVSFEEAMTVFEGVTEERPDPADATRTQTVGFSRAARALIVVTTETTERTRIITARRANSREQRDFNPR